MEVANRSNQLKRFVDVHLDQLFTPPMADRLGSHASASLRKQWRDAVHAHIMDVFVDSVLRQGGSKEEALQVYDKIEAELRTHLTRLTAAPR